MAYPFDALIDLFRNVHSDAASGKSLVVSGTVTTSGTSTISGTVDIDGLGTAALTTTTLDAVTWVEAKVGSGLANRNNLAVQNTSGNTGTVLWNYTNSGSVGWQIPDGASRSVAIKSSGSLKVYLRMLSGSGVVVIEELAP